ncbi:hypothetical protein ABPG74_011920 [Tetrahymena malaccensis]
MIITNDDFPQKQCQIKQYSIMKFSTKKVIKSGHQKKAQEQLDLSIIQYNLEDEKSIDQQEKIDQDINVIYKQEQHLETYQKFNNFQDLKLVNNNNAAKNLIKQFFNYLLKKQNESLVQDFIFHKPYRYCIKLIKKYFKQMTYNNSSLIRLIKHEQYGKGLEYFLTFDAAEQLKFSKVQKFEEHLTMICLFKKYCANQELLEDIHFYKKKCK